MFTFSIPTEERKNMLHRLWLVWFISLVFTAVILLERGTYPAWQAIFGFCNGTLLWLLVDVGDCLIFQNAGKRFPIHAKRYFYMAFACVAANYLAFGISDWLTNTSLLTTRWFQAACWAALNTVLTFIFIEYINLRHRHKENQLSTNEARLKLLESQLEPHMLFNTLANLRALIQTDTEFATKMLDRIVDYMRATLGGSRATMHTLREEFERLDDYLDLMKLRMGERLHYALYLCPELDNYLVPPFILQPLVENAIKHGLEPKVEGGRIFITATIDGNMVSLEVNDTGAGANKEDIAKTKGFGWAQVSERLLATYGTSSALNLVLSDEYNTSAKITFPFVSKESTFE